MTHQQRLQSDERIALALDVHFATVGGDGLKSHLEAMRKRRG